MPKGVAKEIHKLQRKFLWSGGSASRVSALVKWEIIQRPKKVGGLGIGNLLLKNAALLFKWWWRYACEEGSMWRKMVQSLHDEDQVLLSGRSVSTLPGPWKEIKQLALEDAPTTQAFLDNLSIKLGDGTRVRFWLDAWIHETPLKTEFPRLFKKSSQQHESIANMGWFEGQVWRWTLAWRKELTIADQYQLVKLQELLRQYYPSRQKADRIQWCQRSTFSTRELVSKAGQLNQEHAAVDNLASTVWKNIAPPKVEFMVWLALLGKLNTREMPVKKNVISPEVNQCNFCLSHPETIDHLLLSCSFSWVIWCRIAEGLGMRLESHQCFKQFYDWWMSSRIPTC